MSRTSDFFRSRYMPVCVGVVLLMLVMVWQRVRASNLDRESVQLRQAIDRLRYENGRLDTQIHQWTAPSHLDAIARKDYGMQPALPAQQRRLNA